jgi:hypothetical protein
MIYTIAALLSIAFMLSAVPAYPHRAKNTDVSIISAKGEKFFTIPFKDSKKGRTHVIKKYLEARKGENYGISIRNNTAERIGVVIAVDGRNIITGNKSFLKNNERMYVINAYGTAMLEGWRTDRDTVNRFYFTDKNDSYTVRTFNDASAMGVIAVAVFREKKRPVILYDEKVMKREKKAPAAPYEPSAGSKLGDREGDSAGTGFGDEKYSPVVKVRFNPERFPSEKILVKYEWREVLCNKGLLKCRTEEKNRLWDEDEYAPYPPGHNDRS